MGGFCGSAGAGAEDTAGSGTTLIGGDGGVGVAGGVGSVPFGGFNTCGFVRPKMAGTLTDG